MNDRGASAPLRKGAIVAMKPMLTPSEIESQVALELPERDMLSLITIVALNGVVTTITVANNDVAAQVCAQALSSGDVLSCDIHQ
jgi:hypothetical protein